MSNLSVVMDFFEIYEREGSDGVIARFGDWATPDFEWAPPISEIGTPYKGRSGYERYWREVDDSFKTLRFADPRHEEINPDAVLTRMQVQARGRESGAELDEACILISRFRNGRIYWSRAWYDLPAAEQAAAAITRGGEVAA